jgi:hypothetical protein
VGKVALVVAALIGLLAAAAVGFTLTKPGGWQKFESKEGRFKADMPGRVNPTPQTRTMSVGINPVTVTTYRAEQKRLGRVIESAEVSYADLPAAPDADGVPKILAVFANGIRQESGHEEIDRRTVSVDGHIGIGFVLEIGGRDRVVYHMAIVGKRVYVLAVAGSHRYGLDYPRVKRFIESVKFIE